MRMPRFRFTIGRMMVAVAIVLCVGILSWWLIPRPFDLRPFEKVVEEIRRSPPLESGYLRKYEGCYVELGPPLRVAFSEGGLLDNWHGIVYDPTALVLKANLLKRDYSNRHDPAMKEVQGLFGGMMIRAVPLGGPWYRCYFT
jgi:hypothetical protein